MVKHTRMEENKRVYTEDYDTDEYEDLTCECHHLARAKELNGSGRKPFFCIHCKTQFKDKNKLNLHRLEGCFAVTGDGKKTILKIYPVFGKGQRGEIEDILIKHGHMSPRKKPSRAKRKKLAPVLKGTDISSELDIGVEAAEVECTPGRPQKLKVRGVLSSGRGFKKKRLSERHVETQVLHAPEKQVDDNPEISDLAVVEQGQVQMQLKRAQVETQAWKDAKIVHPDASVVPCPEVVPCPGLWHLLKFQLLPSDFPNVKSDSFPQAFHEFVEKGHIDPGLRSSYGTWYMERETDADDKEQNAVKLTMSSFKLIGGRPDLEARNKERLALQKYLQYLQEFEQYKAQKAAADLEVQSHRQNYVKERLDEFDARDRAHKEMALWQWSPLLKLLMSDYIGGVPPRPWSHSDAEHRQISQAILMNRRLIVNTPPLCPVLVRMFKIAYIRCFEKTTSTLSHPVTGLLRETMLGYATNQSAASVLKNSAHSFLNEGYFLFAQLPPHSEAQAEVFQDIKVLLHGPEAECNAVIQKVQTFLSIVRQRAVGDMALLHSKEFRVLWCGGDENVVANALEKFMLCLKSREDLDMGWVSFPSGHPDCDSSAVMQAREAVMKATTELHKQRVLSDSSRLEATGPCLQASNPVTREKFQTLVETCEGKSQKVTVAGANGAGVSKDVVKSVSKVGVKSKNASGSIVLGQSAGNQQPPLDVEGHINHIDNGKSHDVVDDPCGGLHDPAPDLNLNPGTIEAIGPGSAVINQERKVDTHVAGLHVNPVTPPTKHSFLGFEVQASNSVAAATSCPHPSGARSASTLPAFPLHLLGPSIDVQPTSGHEYHLNASVPRPVLHPENHADSVHVVSSLNSTQLSQTSFTAEAPAAAHQAKENCTHRGHLLFNT